MSCRLATAQIRKSVGLPWIPDTRHRFENSAAHSKSSGASPRSGKARRIRTRASNCSRERMPVRICCRIGPMIAAEPAETSSETASAVRLSGDRRRRSADQAEVSTSTVTSFGAPPCSRRPDRNQSCPRGSIFRVADAVERTPTAPGSPPLASCQGPRWKALAPLAYHPTLSSTPCVKCDTRESRNPGTQFFQQSHRGATRRNRPRMEVVGSRGRYNCGNGFQETKDEFVAKD